MRRSRRNGRFSRQTWSFAVSLSVLCAGFARAEDPPPSPGESAAGATDAAVRDARAEFVRGATLVKSAQWAEALVAFERSSRLVLHHITSFNIGACERAL